MNLVIDSQRVAETVTEHARGGVDTLWEQIYRLQGRLPRIRWSSSAVMSCWND